MDSHVRWEFPPIFQHALRLLVSNRISSKLTSISPTSKGVFPVKHRLSQEIFLAIRCKCIDWLVNVIDTVQSKSSKEHNAPHATPSVYPIRCLSGRPRCHFPPHFLSRDHPISPETVRFPCPSSGVVTWV